MYLRAWETWVYCDGLTLEEFAVKVENHNTVSCYIASEVGKKFAVQWKSSLDMLVSADCYMDGRFMGAGRTRPRKSGSKWCMRTGLHTRQPFQFTTLSLTDDDDVASPDDPTTRDLGVIELRICRVEAYNSVSRISRPRTVESRGLIHERSKKAGMHCVSLGVEQSIPPSSMSYVPDTLRYRYLDDYNRPYLRFIFRYRPLAHLKADGIIPPGHPLSNCPRPTMHMKAGTEQPSAVVKAESRARSTIPEQRREVIVIEDTPPPEDHRPPLRNVNVPNHNHNADEDAFVNDDYNYNFRDNTFVAAWIDSTQDNAYVDRPGNGYDCLGRSERADSALVVRPDDAHWVGRGNNNYNIAADKGRGSDGRVVDAQGSRDRGDSYRHREQRYYDEHTGGPLEHRGYDRVPAGDTARDYHRVSEYRQDRGDYGPSTSGNSYLRDREDYYHGRDRHATRASDYCADHPGGSYFSSGSRRPFEECLSDTRHHAGYESYVKTSGSRDVRSVQDDAMPGWSYPRTLEHREVIDLT